MVVEVEPSGLGMLEKCALPPSPVWRQELTGLVAWLPGTCTSAAPLQVDWFTGMYCHAWPKDNFKKVTKWGFYFVFKFYNSLFSPDKYYILIGKLKILIFYLKYPYHNVHVLLHISPFC